MKKMRNIKRMQREKRGDVSIGYLIAGVIALAVFVLFVIFLTQGSGSDVFRFLGTILPGFNRTTVQEVSEERVRYVISSDALEYYDGTAWKAFGEKERILGEKRITGSELKERFHRWYYQGREAVKAELGGGYSVRIVEVIDRNHESTSQGWKSWLESKGLQRMFGSESTRALKRGDVLIELWKRGDSTETGNLQALYVLPIGEARVVSMVKEPEENVLEKNYAWEKEVLRAALQWRERALEKPLTFVYKDKEVKEHDSAACVKRTLGTQELVADLAQEVQAGEKCR